MIKHFFSASKVLGSRSGSVGVGVSGCPGCAWVWRGKRELSLALRVPVGVSLSTVLARCSLSFVSVSIRRHGKRVFLRVRGPQPVLHALARVYSTAYWP